MRIRLGTALKCRQEPFHRWVIVSDPEHNGGYVVLVRVTSDTGRWRDRDCILTPQDWGELEHPSTVAYSTTLCGRVEVALIQAIRAGEFEVSSSPPPATLLKIVAAGRVAEGMPPKAQALLFPVPNSGGLTLSVTVRAVAAAGHATGRLPAGSAVS